ncbi:hypothetical protein D3C71_822160 [compost metagenome]
MNNESSGGTKCNVVTPYCWTSCAMRCGSRCSPGAAISNRAPVISGQKHSHTDTSKLIGAFCISTSVSFRR